MSYFIKSELASTTASPTTTSITTSTQKTIFGSTAKTEDAMPAMSGSSESSDD